MRKSKEEKISELGRESVPKLICGYSVVTFFSLFLNSIYSLTDALFVGRGVGTEALGAVSAVFPITVLQGAVSTMIGGGAAIIVSNLLGKNDTKKGGSVVLTAAILFWSISVVTSVAGLIFIDPLIDILGVAEGLKGYAKQYLIIILIGNVFSTGFSAVMRAEGKMGYALMQWVVPISVNIALDALFIPIMKMGVQGAALATVISQVISFLTAMVYFLKISGLQFKGAKVSRYFAKKVVSTGVPSLVQQGSVALALALLNSAFKFVGGSSLQITYGIIGKIFMLCIVPFTAITQALQPVIGYNIGAGNRVRVRDSVKWTVIFSFAASLASLVVCEAMPQLLVGMFTDNKAIISEGAAALRYVALAFPLMFIPSVAGAIFQSVGKKIHASLLFAVNFILVPPLALLVGHICGRTLIWLSFPIAGFIASTVSVIPLVLFFKTINPQKIGERLSI